MPSPPQAGVTPFVPPSELSRVIVVYYDNRMVLVGKDVLLCDERGAGRVGVKMESLVLALLVFWWRTVHGIGDPSPHWAGWRKVGLIHSCNLYGTPWTVRDFYHTFFQSDGKTICSLPDLRYN